MNVLSLCDGISSGQIALQDIGAKIDKYYASEIDKNAIRITQDNFPNTIQLGDIKTLDDNVLGTLPKIDLILCGFPCRDLSIVTRQGGSDNWTDMHKKGEGLKGQHSGLYYEFIRILEYIKKNNNSDVKFLVENVASMKDSDKAVIDSDLGVNGREIDSAKFSAQERKRLYWFNFNVCDDLPECSITLKDILDDQVDEKYYEHRQIDDLNVNNRIVGRLVFDFKAHDIAARVYNINYKAPTLTACRGGNLQKKIYYNGRVRKLTPHEYRRLQTIPNWYKMDVSDSVIYNVCGDGWTIEVIKFILNQMICETRNNNE